MVMHLTVTPESGGQGLSHSTFFTYNIIYVTTGFAAKVPSAIKQLPLQLEIAGKVAYFEVSKASVAAAATIQG